MFCTSLLILSGSGGLGGPGGGLGGPGGVFFAQVPAVALPLLLPVLKPPPGPPKPPPGPPKPPEPLRINRLTQNAVENSLYSVLC